MNWKKIFALILIPFVVGYLVADRIALMFAKSHGVKKYGGIFQTNNQ